MAIFTLTVIQGFAYTQTLQLNPPTTFQGTELLSATISTGGTAAPILTAIPTWSAGQSAGSYSKIDFTLTALQTASLAPDYYTLIIALADNSAALSWGLVEVVSSPSQAPTQDFLVTPAEVLGLVPDLCTIERLADLPRVIASATQAIRKYCCRNFTRRTITKEFKPNYTGQVRLDDIPVNEVIRIATQRDAAMFIEGPSNAQIANVRYAYTGDYDSGLTTTGLILTKTVSAVTTSSTLLFTTYPTITTIADAINALGWTATVTPGYALWPSTELVGGTSSQGALTSSGAQLDVYSQDASMERLDQETGMVWLGYGGYRSPLDTPAWGPDWLAFTTPQRFPSLVKITYDAGYDAIPSPIVMAAIEVVQAAFSRLQTDQIIQSETAAEYSYQLRDQLDFLPESAKHALATYRLFNA